ncbi:MAG: hydrogenase maturation protein [Gallionellales bacterium GWA2_59_43]|nr:MAG: hydrogenase maturation protein [Gallionellales bacterium GWA2_59_43]
MRILLLTHSYNSLTQRLHAELAARGHELAIEFDIADSVSEEAVELFQPDLIVAPYLRRAIPESIWENHVCLVVHPGIIGDRGPSALDRAIQSGEAKWGVTVLQAEAEMDAGPVWASETFAMRRATKSSLYRNEVAEAACCAVLTAVERFSSGSFDPMRLSELATLRPLLKQEERRIDWKCDDTATVLRKIAAADGFPGVADQMFGEPCHLYDAQAESNIGGGQPGDIIARRETALLRATVDGAVWIGHVRRHANVIKLPTALAYADEAAIVPELPLANWWKVEGDTWQDIAYREQGGIGYLHFEFYNGAMGTQQCQRLLQAYRWALTRPTRVVVLMGGADFWSNGIHLNLIEAAESPADESWANINAMNDLAEAIIRTESHLTIAALQGNAGAGGCFLARAADQMWLRDGVLLNPHYKNMGNLYGSEYWTYLLPPRVGEEGARAIMRNRLPLTAQAAVAYGFADACLSGDSATFLVEVARRADELACSGDFLLWLTAKRVQRIKDEAAKPLSQYREEELAQMRRNFYGFDPSYHVARYHFVRKSPNSWTPRHLAPHRNPGWQAPA